jgi:hypothetical protein
MKQIFCAALTGALAALAGAACADTTITGALAKFVAKPTAAEGFCPQTITFDGFIAVYGEFEAGHPAQFAVQFLRSDGQAGPISYFTVSAIGKHTVSDTWSLGGPSQPSYSGWEQVKAWPTANPSGPGAVLSEKADFTVTCQGERLPHPAPGTRPPPGAVLNNGR